jgi:hypothetical protein
MGVTGDWIEPIEPVERGRANRVSEPVVTDVSRPALFYLQSGGYFPAGSLAAAAALAALSFFFAS